MQPPKSALPAGPPRTGLEVVIDRQIPTRFPGTALILEIEFHVTNYDTVEHLLTGVRITGPLYFGRGQPDAEYTKVLHKYGELSERRRGEQLQPRIRAGQTLYAVHVTEFAWDPTGSCPIHPDHQRRLHDLRGTPAFASPGSTNTATP